MANSTNHPNTLKYHKPNCKCPPCKRAAKARADGAGTPAEVKAAEAEARVPDLSSKTPEVLVVGGTPVLQDNRSFQARILQIVALKAQGLNNRQIAEKLGLAKSTIDTLVYKANKQKLIEYTSPHEYFENVLTHKVVENIEYFLNEKDHKMTIEAAKGAGIFKSHQALKLETEIQQNIIALKIEMPPLTPSQQTQLAVGTVVGKPRRVLEGQIVGESEEQNGGQSGSEGLAEAAAGDGGAAHPSPLPIKPSSLP